MCKRAKARRAPRSGLRAATVRTWHTVEGARAFEAGGDLFAQFFGVASQLFCLLAEPFQLLESKLLLRGHEFSVERAPIAVTEKRISTAQAEHSPSITSGANSLVSARSTKSSGTASASVKCWRSSSSPPTRRMSMR